MGRDGAIAVGLLALCALLWVQLGTVPSNPLVPIGPTFYPKLLLGVMTFLALTLLAMDLRAGHRAAPRGPASGWAAYRPAGVCFGLSVFYAFLLPGIGYLAATTLYVAGLAWGLGPPVPRRLPGALLLGAATSLVTYQIFQGYLHVFLPRAGWFG